MANYYDVPEDQLTTSSCIFRKIIQDRGWKAEKVNVGAKQHLILTRPDGKSLRVTSTGVPPTTSAFAKLAADDKTISYNLMKSAGIPQPETLIVNSIDDVRTLLEKYQKIVIKPIDGAHGNGVTTNITTLEQAAQAITYAKDASLSFQEVIAQEQLEPVSAELRVICINYQFIEAIARIPAHVTGDGKHTIAELIEIENSTIRAKPYKDGLAYIDTVAATQYLGEKLNQIPAAGESVRVVSSCNIGQGGTAEDYTDRFSTEQRQLSEKIAQLFELPMIGIDFYGDKVIEVNAQPLLYYPTGNDTATKAILAYVDYLETL